MIRPHERCCAFMAFGAVVTGPVTASSWFRPHRPSRRWANEVIDKAMADLGGTVTRRSTGDFYDEIRSPEAAQEAADKEARRVLSEQHRAEHKHKWEQFKDRVKASLS